MKKITENDLDRGKNPIGRRGALLSYLRTRDNYETGTYRRGRRFL